MIRKHPARQFLRQPENICKNLKAIVDEYLGTCNLVFSFSTISKTQLHRDLTDISIEFGKIVSLYPINCIKMIFPGQGKLNGKLCSPKMPPIHREQMNAVSLVSIQSSVHCEAKVRRRFLKEYPCGRKCEVFVPGIRFYDRVILDTS